MKTVATKNAPAALGPYAQAQVSGGFVFTSGQIGIDPATGVIADGIEAQAHQVFRNLTAVLQAAGSDMSKAVKTTAWADFPLILAHLVHIDHKIWGNAHFSVFLFDNLTALC